MTSSSSQSINFPPFRNTEDFLFGSAVFQAPNFNDFKKWGNRVVNNLLYYQTNYFAVATIWILLIGVIHPLKIILGLLIIAFLLCLSLFLATEKSSNLILLGTGVFFFFVLYFMDALVIVGLSFSLPVTVILIHASLRRRNIKNKITNAMQNLGFNNSPMGLLLDMLAVDPEIINLKPEIFQK